MTNFLIGNGIDIHKIIKSNKPQKLGGLTFNLGYEIIAHSDGDIIFHSLSSAILGALSLDDLGTYFPDTDLKNKNLNSLVILEKTMQLLDEFGFQIVNVDITLISDFIFLKEIKNEIKQNLEKLLKTKISLKGTRFEENAEKIQVNTVLLLSKK
ncbi:MAG: 2-C-methyl-D-erythritol 2,4-cyclodiphosphate synthase [Malacoplasma sp.]|nr:2-C-methyl-D-erythritol 2,4-cyclodiphosphate synthase [Malacoplasma sp.]MDE7099732.1 2-C-methyl-D-erythritol 2,4-cyclodiphosphate synthase [Malacoplasma sp.]